MAQGAARPIRSLLDRTRLPEARHERSRGAQAAPPRHSAGITVPEATGLPERNRLVNDGKANQSDYSGDRDTLGKHLMAGSVICHLNTRLATGQRKPDE